MARSSSGLGRRPLKAEITGSNPVRATKNLAGRRDNLGGLFSLSGRFLRPEGTLKGHSRPEVSLTPSFVRWRARPPAALERRDFLCTLPLLVLLGQCAGVLVEGERR